MFGVGLHAAFPEAGFAPPAFFALAAMAGFVAGIMHAPFTAMLLALETTEGWHGTLPLILVAVLATLVSRSFLRHSFYTHGLAERGALLRPGTDVRILADLRASELLDEGAARIEAGRTLADLAALLPTTARSHFGVVDGAGRLLGVVDVSTLRGVIFDDTLRRITPVDSVMDATTPRIGASETAQEVMERFESSGAWVLPVVDAQGRFLGTVSKATLFDRYRRELILHSTEKHG
jgi:CIC family chloride channel protein